MRADISMHPIAVVTREGSLQLLLPGLYELDIGACWAGEQQMDRIQVPILSVLVLNLHCALYTFSWEKVLASF